MTVDPGTETQRGPSAGEDRYEARDAPAGRVGLLLVALCGALLLLCAAVAGLFVLLDRQEPPLVRADTMPPPEPRLQVREPDQRAQIETSAEQRLRPSRDAIGIDEAMRRTAAAGWGDAR